MIGAHELDQAERTVQAALVVDPPGGGNAARAWCEAEGVEIGALVSLAARYGFATERHPALTPASALMLGFQIGVIAASLR